MKKLLYLSAIMIIAFAYLAGCKQDPSSSNGTMTMTTNTTTSAHPAWAFTSLKTVNSYGYTTIAVSDSDGTNATNVYTSALNDTKLKTSSASWSASGGSVSFIETTSGSWGATSIKSVDVSVSGGVVSGSNVQTIYSRATSDSTSIRAQAWSQTSSVAKIAFIARTPTDDGVYLVSTSGGTATKIYSIAKSSGYLGTSITWSNDGTKIAFIEQDGTSASHTSAIKVINTSGTVQATLESGTFTAIGNVTWSHTGTDMIAFNARTTTTNYTTDNYLYQISPVSGSTSSKIIQGSNPRWSPNNSELVYNIANTLTNAGTNKVTVGTGASTFVGTYIGYGDWKQQ